MNPNVAIFYSNRGITYAALQQNDMAIMDFSHAIELDPNDPQNYYNRANSNHTLQQYEIAIADYNLAIKLNPNIAIFYCNRGLTYNDLGEREKALADYHRAIELEPGLPQAYYNRGFVYYDLNAYDEAIEEFNHVLKIDPNYSPAYYAIGGLLVELGQLDAALPYLEKAIQIGLPDTALTGETMQLLEVAASTAAIEADPGELAFEAFLEASAFADLQQAVNRLPILGQSEFLVALEQFVEQQAPPSAHSALEERLGWLRQIISAQAIRNNR